MIAGELSVASNGDKARPEPDMETIAGGVTFGEAAVLLNQARHFAVCVPTGYGCWAWRNCTITRMSARDFLNSEKPDKPLHSRLIRFAGSRTWLFIGSVDDVRETA